MCIVMNNLKFDCKKTKTYESIFKSSKLKSINYHAQPLDKGPLIDHAQYIVKGVLLW